MSKAEKLFARFAFEVGDLVQHKTNPVRFVVMKRILFENAEHTNWYIVEALNEAGQTIVHQFAEEALEFAG